MYLVSIHTYTCQVFNVTRSVSHPKLWLNKLSSHVNMVVCPELLFFFRSSSKFCMFIITSRTCKIGKRATTTAIYNVPTCYYIKFNSMYIQFEVAPKGEACDSRVIITTFQSTASPDNTSHEVVLSMQCIFQLTKIKSSILYSC